MESQQAGQEEALVEVKVETHCLEAVQRPKGSPADCRGCFKCAVALAIVMGLVIVALVYIHHIFMFTVPSCNQDSHPLNDTAKPYITCNLNKSNEQGRYDILTANKTATYLIYVAVKNASGEVTLIQTQRSSITIQQKTSSKEERDIFFLDKIKLISGTRISIGFESTLPDNCKFLLFVL